MADPHRTSITQMSRAERNLIGNLCVDAHDLERACQALNFIWETLQETTKPLDGLMEGGAFGFLIPEIARRAHAIAAHAEQAMGAPGIGPTLCAPHPDQKLIDLEARWRANDRESEQLVLEIHRTGAADGSELAARQEAVSSEGGDIEVMIATTPAHTVTGLAVKLRRYLKWIEGDMQTFRQSDDDLEIDARLAVSAARDAIRLAGQEG